MVDLASYCESIEIAEDAPETLSSIELACSITNSMNTVVADVAGGLDVFFLLVMGTMVFFMQCGFAMLCAGSVRQKNVKNILFKNLLDACGGALGFWLVGYGFAYGSGSTYIGLDTFALRGISSGADYAFFFFQFAFAATAATIVAGTVAERCKMVAYLCYSIMLTGFVYPIVVRAIWSGDGWLSKFAPEDKLFMGIGMVDFAGSGVVHMTGGATALVAAVILGARKGRFRDMDGNPLSEPESFPPHSVGLQMLGTFILWFGWYGFNPGSALAISPAGYGDVAALSAVTTTIAAATGVVSSVFTNTMLDYMKTGMVEYDLSYAMNGGLGGLVGITANCCVVTPYWACVIGGIAGWVYIACSKLLVSLRIDDAVDAIPVHFGCGIWGCIATGIFAHPDLVNSVYGSGGAGIIYGQGITLLLVELTGVGFIIGWVTAVMTPYFTMLKVMGLFRVDPLEEEVGLDISHHKGSAYDLTAADNDAVDTYIEKRSQHGKGGGSQFKPRGNTAPQAPPQTTFAPKKVEENGGAAEEEEDSIEEAQTNMA